MHLALFPGSVLTLFPSFENNLNAVRNHKQFRNLIEALEAVDSFGCSQLHNFRKQKEKNKLRAVKSQQQ